MRRFVFFFFLGFLALACESIVGTDFGAYSGKCTPFDDKCPKGTACVYDTDAQRFQCAPANGMGYQDARCTVESDCQPGFACSRFEKASSGHCTRYCRDASECPTQSCIRFSIARSLPTGAEVGACGPLQKPCQPIGMASNGCEPYRCTVYDTDYTVCDGLEMMLKMPNEACDFLQQCPQGTTCFGSSDNGFFCRIYCDPQSPSCPNGFTCTMFNPPITIQGKSIGLCR